MNTDTELKAFYEAGDKPTAAQFSAFIDAKRHKWDAEYPLVGAAVTTTVPAVTTVNCCYIASKAGTYTNFSSLVVYPGEVCALKLTVNPTTGIGTWSKQVLFRVDDLLVTTEIYGQNLMQGNDVSVYVPTAVSLRCETTAATPTYQWQQKSLPADSWASVTGGTSATLTFDESDVDIWGDRTYVLIRCKVTDSQSNIFYSNIINCQMLTDLT